MSKVRCMYRPSIPKWNRMGGKDITSLCFRKGPM